MVEWKSKRRQESYIWQTV